MFKVSKFKFKFELNKEEKQSDRALRIKEINEFLSLRWTWPNFPLSVCISNLLMLYHLWVRRHSLKKKFWNPSPFPSPSKFLLFCILFLSFFELLHFASLPPKTSVQPHTALVFSLKALFFSVLNPRLLYFPFVLLPDKASFDNVITSVIIFSFRQKKTDWRTNSEGRDKKHAGGVDGERRRHTQQTITGRRPYRVRRSINTIWTDKNDSENILNFSYESDLRRKLKLRNAADLQYVEELDLSSIGNCFVQFQKDHYSYKYSSKNKAKKDFQRPNICSVIWNIVHLFTLWQNFQHRFLSFF